MFLISLNVSPKLKINQAMKLFLTANYTIFNIKVDMLSSLIFPTDIGIGLSSCGSKFVDPGIYCLK